MGSIGGQMRLIEGVAMGLALVVLMVALAIRLRRQDLGCS
jgi:hypothetical protein